MLILRFGWRGWNNPTQELNEKYIRMRLHKIGS